MPQDYQARFKRFKEERERKKQREMERKERDIENRKRSDQERRRRNAETFVSNPALQKRLFKHLFSEPIQRHCEAKEDEFAVQMSKKLFGEYSSSRQMVLRNPQPNEYFYVKSSNMSDASNATPQVVLKLDKAKSTKIKESEDKEDVAPEKLRQKIVPKPFSSDKEQQPLKELNLTVEAPNKKLMTAPSFDHVEKKRKRDMQDIAPDSKKKRLC